MTRLRVPGKCDAPHDALDLVFPGGTFREMRYPDNCAHERKAKIENRLQPVARLGGIVRVARGRDGSRDGIENKQGNAVWKFLRGLGQSRHIGCGIEWPGLPCFIALLMDGFDALHVRAHADQTRGYRIVKIVFARPYQNVADRRRCAIRQNAAR